MSDEKITNSHPTKYWHKLDDGKVQCDVCPRACKLHEGQRGLCFVRARLNDEIVLTSYGRSTGYCIDPIEKKPLNHFLPGTAALSFGTAGCNLTCKFCQNWDISKSRQTDILAKEATPEMIARSAKESGCKSVAFTYNDPVVFMEYAIDTAKACHELGIKAVAVTAGYICAPARKDFFEHMDAVNVDLKAFSEEFYQKLCSASLKDTLDTLIYLKNETDVWLEITTLLIPDENDSAKEIDDMTKWIFNNLGPDVPLHFSAFHPDYKMMDKVRTPLETLIRARDIALKNGLNYVYTGNVWHPETSSTYCCDCGDKIIGRDYYEVSYWNLSDGGKCKNCQTQCNGVFDGGAGSWGNKRSLLEIED
jgi:pyruvate formate lyase activating enzyme